MLRTSALCWALFLVGCGKASPLVVEPLVSATAAPSTSAPPLEASVVLSSALAPSASTSAPSAPPAWSYDAPDRWAALSPTFAACASGEKQTPIDIVAKSAEPAKDLKPLKFDYSPIPLRIVSSGRTVEVRNSVSATLGALDQSWSLERFHFHVPSEHTFDGHVMASEMHLVHKNASGAYAVVAVMIKAGKANQKLAPVFDHIPKTKSLDPEVVDNVVIDMENALPTKRGYFTYVGSLTVPPCTEGVTWLLLKEPIEMSPEQIAKLTDALGPKSARPIQPSNGRVVRASSP